MEDVEGGTVRLERLRSVRLEPGPDPGEDILRRVFSQNQVKVSIVDVISFGQTEHPKRLLRASGVLEDRADRPGRRHTVGAARQNGDGRFQPLEVAGVAEPTVPTEDLTGSNPGEVLLHETGRAVLEHGTAAPLSWTRCLYRFKWIDTPDQSIYAVGAFPGQAQMVARFDTRYGRTKSLGQFDVDSTYDGGKGLVSLSLGIDRVIADGGDMIAMLRKKPIHPDVGLCVLAGTHPWIAGEVGDRRAPCDGLVLVASVFDLEPMTRRGAKVLKKDLRALNHLQLAYDPRGNDWVLGALND